MEQQKTKKYEQYGVPQSITLEDFKYTYKGNLKDEKNFIYRCIHRECKAQITIDKENILKILAKNENSSIEYKEGKNKHTCENKKREEKKEVKANLILSSNEINELGIKLIKQHIDKPLSFHLDNLKNNNIPFAKNKIKNLLEKYREESFPEDHNYLDHIDYIKITFDQNKDDFKDLPFCYLNLKYLNPEKNNRLESLILFTSEIQLKKLEKAEQIFMDATFKVCPKNFYQLFNIIISIEEGKFIFPVIHVLMTHKSEFSYRMIFNNLNIIIKAKKIEFNFEKKHIMTDFEHALRNILKELYPNCYLEGCFFHYSKALWKKAKKIGLINKNSIKITRFIIFAYKMYPFMNMKDKEIFLKSINKYIEKEKDNKKLKKLSNYFHKNWEKSNFIDFDSIDNSKIKHRTNNQVELFHRNLNQIIENSHPKISYLLDKLKLVIINKYNDYLIFDNKKINIDVKKYDIFNDIFNFVKKFSKKYKLNFNFDLLLQLEENSLNDLRKICDNILEEIYDISFLSEEEAGEDENEEEFKENNEEELFEENKEKIEEEKKEEENENISEKDEDDKTFYLYEEIQKKRKRASLNILEEIYGKNKK